jgi:hypothetical protein
LGNLGSVLLTKERDKKADNKIAFLVGMRENRISFFIFTKKEMKTKGIFVLDSGYSNSPLAGLTSG